MTRDRPHVFFQAGGTLSADALYVERPADRLLPALLLEGEFCYVLAPRQIGKSSLSLRVRSQLEQRGVRCAYVDISRLASSDATEERWYFANISRIGSQLGISRNDLRQVWEGLSPQDPLARWTTFLEEDLLSRIDGPIVIFIDEIDTLRARRIDSDDFFAAIRALYNARPVNPELRRLTFCMLGVASPADLMRDPARTPFNIGHAVPLSDFTRSEAVAFLAGLHELGTDSSRLLDAILDWTGGHPYMTQALCQALTQQKSLPDGSDEEQWAAHVVDERFMRRGRIDDPNLSYAEKRFNAISPAGTAEAARRLYARLLEEQQIRSSTDDPVALELKLCGLAAEVIDDTGSWLRIRNRIFAAVFDAGWLSNAMQRTPFKDDAHRWIEERRNEALLLNEERLLEAERWLGLQDEVDVDIREFLQASQIAVLKRLERERQKVRQVSIIILITIAAMVSVIYFLSTRQVEQRLRAEVDSFLSRAAPLMGKARAKGEAYRRARSAADEHFRQGARVPGEAAWQRALILAPEVEDNLARALLALELAFQLDAVRPDVREQLAAALHEQALLAAVMGRDAELARLVERIRALGMGELAEQWTASVPVELTTSPPSRPVTLYRYESADDGTLAPMLVQPARQTPQTWQLRPGSYLLTLQSDERTVDIRLPFRVVPGHPETAPVSLHIDVPGREQVPRGFVHVPAGSFLFGFGGDESMEPVRAWYKTTPPHQRDTGAFLIARHETTYEDWLAFLRSLPATERAARAPRATFDTTHVALSETDGNAALEFRAVTRTYHAAAGQPIVYESRDRRASQDWLQFPVTGISGEDAHAYLSWLDRTGRVPGARFCREDEWERAARGADGRQYPHGDRLAPDDADFDATYGKKDDAYGFDQVGSHPASRSPFGVDDMVGNARELTLSVLNDTKLVVRGGDFFRSLSTNAIVNREYMTAAQRSPYVGLRVCADPPAPGAPR